MTTIIGVKLNNRKENAQVLQDILTEYGCSIKTRVGLHLAKENECSNEGLILLEVIDSKECEDLIEALKQNDEIIVKTMKF